VAGLHVDTFHWLLDHSIGFNRFVMNQLNERLGQFIAAREIDRLTNPDIRVARSLAALFNPVLYPGVGEVLRITQQELAYLVGLIAPAGQRGTGTLAAQGSDHASNTADCVSWIYKPCAPKYSPASCPDAPPLRYEPTTGNHYADKRRAGGTQAALPLAGAHQPADLGVRHRQEPGALGQRCGTAPSGARRDCQSCAAAIWGRTCPPR